jgi:MerR family transcriptional regulator, light-induced transcriptional regulator
LARWLRASEVANLIGVPLPTIRSWERRYEWPRPARTTGGHRRYTPDEVDQLRALRDEIARGTPPRDAVVLLRQLRDRRHSFFVSRIVEAAVELEWRGVRQALAQAEVELGVEKTVIEVILPALKEVGLRWERRKCDVGGEHMTTDEIRRWLGRVLLEGGVESSRPTVVLSTGPADVHTVGVEAFAVVLSRRGWDCLELGGPTPTESVINAVQKRQAAAAIITSHRAPARRLAVETIRITSSTTGARVYYAGNAFGAVRSRRGVPGTYLGGDLIAAAELMEEEVTRR